MAKRRKTARRAAKPKRRGKPQTKRLISKRKAKRPAKRKAARRAPPAPKGPIARVIGAAKEAVGLRQKLEGHNTFED